MGRVRALRRRLSFSTWRSGPQGHPSTGPAVPSGTKLYLHNISTNTHPGVRSVAATDLTGATVGWLAQLLSTTAGGLNVAINSYNFVAGPTNGIETTPFTSHTGEWMSLAIDTPVTISGPILLNIWAHETLATGNAAINGSLERLAADGSVSVIATTNNTAELPTSSAVHQISFSVTPTALVKGDRIRFRPYFDDAPTMAASGNGVINTGSPTGGTQGDSWLAFTETITFQSTVPTGSILYLNSVAGPAAGAADEREMWTSRGAASTTADVNTAAGFPLAPIQWTNASGGTIIEWYSRPLQAFTLSGLVKYNIRARESSTTANVDIHVELAVTASNGSGATVLGKANGTQNSIGGGVTGELSATDAAKTGWISVPDTNITAGQRLRFRAFIIDAAAIMASGLLAFLSYDGPTAAAAGDSWIQLPQTVLELTAAPISGRWGAIPTTITPYTEPAAAVGWDKLLSDDTALLSTTDKAQLDITQDLCIVACIRPDVIANGANQRIAGKWSASQSYGLSITSVGLLTLHISTTGANDLGEVSSAGSPLTNYLNDGEKFWVAAAIDTNNGASGRDKKFWWKRDGDATWTQLGSTITSTPNQTIFSGSADLSIGRFTSSTGSQFNGTIYKVEIYSGIGAFTAPGQGTLVAEADMRTQWVADSYSDGLGNTWTRANGTWKADPIYTIATATGLTGARFPHFANDTTVMVPDSLDNSLSVWSYATGNSIVRKGTTGTMTELSGARSAVMDATGAYAFVVSLESDTFAVYDMRQDKPQLVTSIVDATNLNGARGIIRVGNYCYVTARDGGRLTSVRVTVPTSPVVAHSIAHANLTDARGLMYQLSGASVPHVFVAANSVSRVTAINISNPELMTYAGSIQDTTYLSGVHELAGTGDGLIAACVNSPGRITAVDVYDPTAMTLGASTTLGLITQSAYSLEVDPGTLMAYISNLDLGWVTMFDVQNWNVALPFRYALRPGTLTTGGGIYMDYVKKLLMVVSYDEGTIALMKISGTT